MVAPDAVRGTAEALRNSAGYLPPGDGPGGGSPRRGAGRPLRGRARDRPRRHGHGVSGAGPEAPPPRGDQGAARAPRREPRRRALPPRNPDRRAPAAPPHRAAVRLRPGGRPAVLRDAVHRWRIASAPARARDAAAPRRDAPRDAG